MPWPTTILTALILTASAAAAQQPSTTTQQSKDTVMSISDDVRSVTPALATYTDQVLLGDLWKRTDLTLRDRNLITVTALIAANQTDLLPAYLDRALDDGVRPSEISEIITHLAFYTGWPNSFSASGVAKAAFLRHGIGADQLAVPGDPISLDPDSEKQRIASVEQALGGVAPAFRDYTNGVLFGDLWRRPGLSPRDRSLVTITALIVGDKTQQLVGHLNRALDNGLTKAEAGAVITHLAFYAGWPNAMSAAMVAKGVFDKRS